jgi:hypothetical protein
MSSIVDIYEIEGFGRQQFQMAIDVLADCVSRETIQRAPRCFVPPVMADLRAQEELWPHTAVFQPPANRATAVNLTVLPMQMDTVTAQAEIFVERLLVPVRVRRRGMGHHVAQSVAEGRHIDLSECHS